MMFDFGISYIFEVSPRVVEVVIRGGKGTMLVWFSRTTRNKEWELDITRPIR